MRWHVFLIVASAGVVCCGACAATSSRPAATTKTTASAGEDDATLPLCLQEGAIPEDATRCRLDLQLVGDGERRDSYWRASDGMDPGTAGCLTEYRSDTCTERVSAQTFGEFCVDEDRLIESTAEAGACHTRVGDVSTPRVVSCAAWCATQGSPSGRCEPFVAVEGPSASCESARCACGPSSTP